MLTFLLVTIALLGQFPAQATAEDVTPTPTPEDTPTPTPTPEDISTPTPTPTPTPVDPTYCCPAFDLATNYPLHDSGPILLGSVMYGWLCRYNLDSSPGPRCFYNVDGSFLMSLGGKPGCQTTPLTPGSCSLRRSHQLDDILREYSQF